MWLKISVITLVGALLGIACQRALALDSSSVLVVYNAASSEGQEIAEYYAQVHPGVSLLAVDNVPVAEDIDEQVYLNQIRPQILAGLNSSIDCIVTTKGMPLRITNGNCGSNLITNVYSSLESELTRIDTISSAQLMGNQMPEMDGIPPMFTNPYVMNPYSGDDAQFDYDNYGIRLTSRLDGFSVADVKASIDAAQRVVYGDMNFLVDDHPGLTYDRMSQLADNLAVYQDRNQLTYQYDDSDAFLCTSETPVMGYVTHGIHGSAPVGYILDDQSGLQFDIAPGAVFYSWESYNANSFDEDGNRNGQGLLAEWISRGGAAAVGTVEEPIAASINVTNEQRLLELMLSGYTWAEAAWSSTSQLSFVNTVVGDPLMTWHEFLADGDINGDGIVSLDDLDIVLSNWGQTVEPGDILHGDASGDGIVCRNDLDIVLSDYGFGCTESGHAPEPACLSMLALGACALLARRHRACGN